jgi:hypothetical protein
MSTVLVVIALNALGYLVMYLILNDRIRRSSSPASQIQGLREEVDRLVIELNQTTARNIALIEDKIAELTEALAKADRKIGLFRRESEKHDVGAKVYSRILEAKTDRETQKVESPDAAPRGKAENPGGALRDIQKEIISLHRAGFSAPLISSRVGAPLGEVELVISLEKRKASQ